ncbi:N-6 DNA methylase [Sphingomonas sp. So64.6b]|uniref:N-6 DNA methylase n=1 Tax=Sphingomonas sp. So64.6b TaxID=2997354 RepID=UPI0015FEC0AC|nr:N-6 DNA methylase [Sphingomonas sp. So64.6b]QNA83788.1 N-6 DNA methylase [Sphingomonas sp. So64.6b]
MSLASILDLVAKQTAMLGYRDDAVRREYAYSDVWVASGGTRSVPMVAFTQTPPSYRSAAFAVAEGTADVAQALVESHRALGAPLFFVVEGDQVSCWQVYARKAPRLLERFSVDSLSETFHRHRNEWAPDVIHRAKSIGRVDVQYQRDFVDIGLIPAIEGEIHTKLDRLIREAVADVRHVSNGEAMRLLFRGVFRLLAAKILTDRQNLRAQSWDADNVADVLSAMGDYYSLGKDAQIWPARTLAMLGPVWSAFRTGFNVANISADDLAYVYESTLVTPQARAQFGTHSTPRHVADYVLDRFRLWEFGTEPLNVYEPFAGAGVFLGSALRQMRDGLPHNWTDKQRHDLLIRHIGGAEIDPFACEVAKLSLILADYPNANGWQIEEKDLFSRGTLSDRLKGQDVILCNPPFEAFTADERAQYPDAHAVDGSKAVFALATALQAKPKMLGFVVPNTMLVDRRYRAQRREVEELYREIELVSLPDGVFNVSQLDTALLIARDLRETGTAQRLRSSAVFDADKKRFAVDRMPSHVSEETRDEPATGDGTLWSPPLQHVWSALQEFPRLGDLVHGHWGLRWHGELKTTPRGFDLPGKDRVPGYMDSSALDQFVLGAPRFLDAGPGAIRWGDTYDWSAPKILANAGRLSRGYWRLAAAVDRDGRRASQQLIAFWPVLSHAHIDLDAVAALLNGPVINAFLAEHSFDKRFRIRTIERAPVPKHIPETLGDLSRAYAAAAQRAESKPEDLTSLLSAIDALTIDAYGLSADLRRDLLAAFGTNERPVRGVPSRRRSRKTLVSGVAPALPLFVETPVEVDHGEELEAPLSDEEAARQVRSIAKVVPVENWAGPALPESGLREALAVPAAELAAWVRAGQVLGFSDGEGATLFPIEQFVDGAPVAELNEVVSSIGDARVAWLWLTQPHIRLDRQTPLHILKMRGVEELRLLIERDFR